MTALDLTRPVRYRRVPVLAVRGATKRFGAVSALDGIDLDSPPRSRCSRCSATTERASRR